MSRNGPESSPPVASRAVSEYSFGDLNLTGIESELVTAMMDIEGGECDESHESNGAVRPNAQKRSWRALPIPRARLITAGAIEHFNDRTICADTVNRVLDVCDFLLVPLDATVRMVVGAFPAGQTVRLEERHARNYGGLLPSFLFGCSYEERDVMLTDICVWDAARWMDRAVCFHPVPRHSTRICTTAAAHGAVRVLEWARDAGFTWDEAACTAAAQAGHLTTLRWLRSRGCPWNEHTCMAAAETGRSDVLRYLRAQGCPWNAWVFAHAAEAGDMTLLAWLAREGCPWDEWACAYAAKSGHMEALRWLRARGCPWGAWTCAYAARQGHFEILVWLRAQGCPWSVWTCSYAVEGGHFEILTWAHENGCPLDDWARAYAEHYGRTEVIAWLDALS